MPLRGLLCQERDHNLSAKAVKICMTNKNQFPSRPPENRSLNAEIAFKIGERICSGEFSPGSVLPNEAEWGKIYGASRTAIREGMKVLQAKGLILSRPKIGTVVSPRSAWNVLDRDVLAWHGAALGKKAFLQSTQEFRRHIEPGIVELAALKRSVDQLDAITVALGRMKTAKTSGEIVAADVAFHRGILAAANNELLNPLGFLIEETLSTLFKFTTEANPRYSMALDLHAALLAAIKDQNPTAARRASLALIDDTDRVIALPAKSVAAKARASKR
jgi:DNA-binding FadR family transcriptional regulator